jgi:hypothetical protein
MSARAVDRIDPFTSKASVKSKKQKRSQGSSHYRTKNAPELQALPQLKGKAHPISLILIYYIDWYYYELTARTKFMFIKESDEKL